MKKAIFTTLLAMSVSSVFAGDEYVAKVVNNTDMEVLFQENQKIVDTIEPKSEKTFDLNLYRPYAFKYQGKWAEQSLGGISQVKESGDEIFNIAVVEPWAGRSNVKISLDADGNTGYVNSLTDKDGNYSNGGICDTVDKDSGVVTCKLSDSGKLQQLYVTFDSVDEQNK